MKGKRSWIIGFCIVVLGMTVFMIGSYLSGKGRLSNNIALSKVLQTKENSESYQILQYWGKEYLYKENLINILCLGIDKEEIMSERDDDGNSVGQADAIFLVSLDLKENKIRILAIPRDTIVELQMYDGNLNYKGTRKGQITLQYAYADGQTKSAVLMAEQVSMLLNQIPINAYVAINKTCMEAINDVIGGVDITMDADYTVLHPDLKEGKTVHLIGETFKCYVFNRDIREERSAYTRIHRIKQYIMAGFEKSKEVLKEDLMLPIILMEKLNENIETDITVDELTYIIAEIIAGDISIDTIETLPGKIVRLGEYEKYYVDEGATTKILIDLFYTRSYTGSD